MPRLRHFRDRFGAAGLEQRAESRLAQFGGAVHCARGATKEHDAAHENVNSAIDEREKGVTLLGVAALIERRAKPLSSQGQRRRATNLGGEQ
jgi:hypothetical protein